MRRGDGRADALRAPPPRGERSRRRSRDAPDVCCGGSTMIRAADLVYRALYRGLLARLPEQTAVAAGQRVLRGLPFDRLSIFQNPDPRLRVALGGVALANPLILSSMYYDTRILSRVMGLGFGAVTAKSITRNPRPGHPQPNLVRITTAEGTGLVNCNGFQNPGLEAYRRALARLPHRVPLIVAAAGESAAAYVDVVAGGGDRGIRRPRRDQHLVTEHHVGLRVVDASGRRRAALPSGEAGDAQAPHREGVARLPVDERGRADSGRARGRNRHRQLREYAP